MLKLPIPIFSRKKLLLAFEYGLILGEVAKAQGVEVNPQLVERIEEIISQEFPRKSASKLACEMELNLLAAFETN